MQCFERVVSIESERFVEQLYDETITMINQKYDFSPKEEEAKQQINIYKIFEDLETAYSNQELDTFLENLIDSCDLELSKRLKNILSVSNLVEVRNDFEQRISNYFESSIKEQNIIQSRKLCHNLLDQISCLYQQQIQEHMNVKNQSPDAIQNIFSIYNKIIVQYNLLAPKDIPYRSEAIADFM